LLLVLAATALGICLGGLAPAEAQSARILYSAEHGSSGTIYSIRPNGADRRLVKRNGLDPSWSRNRHRIAFVRHGRVFVMRADGSHARRVRHTRRALVPELSATGRKIVFVAYRTSDYHSAIYTIRRDGSHRRRLTGFGENTSSPTWSRSGRFIFYSTAEEGIVRMRASDGHGKRTLIANAFDPALSRLGDRIAYSSQGRIYAARLDGSEAHAVTTSVPDPPCGLDDPDCGPRSDFAPAWSPSGTRLAYRSLKLEGDEYRSWISTIRPDGSGHHVLVSGTTTTDPDW